MGTEENKQLVAHFVEICQNKHDLAAADALFHPDFVDHYALDGQSLAPAPTPAGGFQAFYGQLLQAFPDATMAINEQLAERDLVATRKTLRGTHLGALRDLPPTGNRVAWEFIDIFRIQDGKLVEHWAAIDLDALRRQLRP